MITDIITDGLLAAIAAVGFGAISYPPRKAFKYIAILAAAGHALRYTLMNYAGMDIASSSFCASLAIGLLALWFGRLSHCPLTVLYIPALLPMIPGMYAYINQFFVNATVTVSVVFLLAGGATLVIFLFPKKAYSMTRRKTWTSPRRESPSPK